MKKAHPAATLVGFLAPCEIASVNTSRRQVRRRGNSGRTKFIRRKAADLQQALEALFDRENRSDAAGATIIPATFLRVTVTR